jgi:hypothetical protein
LPHLLTAFGRAEAVASQAEELLGCYLFASALHKNIQDVAVLIHGLPQVVTFALDREEDRFQVPLATCLGTPAAELIRTLLAKFPGPLADGLVGHDWATDEQEFLHIVVAEAEPEIEPNHVPDDLGREVAVLILVGSWRVHALNMAHQAGIRHADQ